MRELTFAQQLALMESRIKHYTQMYNELKEKHDDFLKSDFESRNYESIVELKHDVDKLFKDLNLKHFNEIYQNNQ